MFEELDKQFPNCPFIISCIDNLDELDEIFTYEPVIFIYDGRVNEHNYYYENTVSLSKYSHYLKVEMKQKNEHITLRQIINAMIDDAHYHNEFVKHDPHRFLESFDKSNNLSIQLSCFFGS